MNKFAHPLKLAAGVLALVAWVVNAELSKRELDHAVEKALDERGVPKGNNPNVPEVK